MAASINQKVERNALMIHRGLRPLYVSETWANLHGYDAADILEMPSIRHLCHPDDQDCLIAFSGKSLDADRENSKRLNYRAVRKDGRLMRIHMTVQSIEWRDEPAILLEVVETSASAKPSGGKTATLPNAANPAELRLLNVIDQLPDGYALYDADERLVVWNQRYIAYAPAMQRACQAGDRFETLIRTHLENGTIKDAVGQEEAWCAKRLEVFRAPDNQSMYVHYQNRVVQARHIKTVDGGTLLILVDVTEASKAESELRTYASALEQVADRISILDRNYRFIFVNDALTDFYGKQRDFFLGRHLADVVGDELFATRSRDDLDRCFAGESVHAQHSQPDEEGETRYFDVHLEPFKNEAGEIFGAIIVFRDVTEATRRGRELQVARSAIDQIAERVLIFDKDERILFLNQQNLDFFGLEQNEAIGMHVGELLGWGDSNLHEESKVASNLALKRGVPFRHEYWRPNIDGESRFWETFLVPYREADSSISGAIATSRDMTEHRRAEQAKQRFQDAIEHISDGYALFDDEERLVACNRYYRQKQSPLTPGFEIGVSFEAIIRSRVAHGTILDAVGREEEWITERLASFRADSHIAVFRESSGRWSQVRNNRTVDGGTLLVVTDITESKRIEEALSASEARFKDFTELATDWFWEQDALGRFTYFSESFETLTKWPICNILGKTSVEICDNIMSDDPTWQNLWREQQATGIDRTIDFEHDLPTADGQMLRVRTTFRPIKNAAGVINGYRGAAKNITAAYCLEKQLEYQANHDALTGLLNRRAFERHLEYVIKAGAASRRTSVFCFIDLDQFKIVNDTVGHLAGDRLIRQVAKLLSGKIRKEDRLARLGGDEFGLLFQECSLRRAQSMARKLLASLNADRFLHDDHLFEISASMGLTAIRPSHKNVSQILAEADLACYAAKDEGRNRVQVYQDSDRQLSRRRDEMSKASLIRWALDQDSFALFAQPIRPLADAKTGPVSYEILLRLIKDDGTLVSPSDFIPAAERYGLMTEIDRWVIRQSFALYPELPYRQAGARMNINLSGLSLNEGTLIGFIKNALRSAAITPSHVCFEITETAAIRSLAKTRHLIDKLREIGCQFALDDFGSGLSSFSYLKQLPVDYLKIDGSFTRDMLADHRSRTMVEAIHHVAKSLGLQTVAECVETGETAEALRAIGIDYAQGIAVGRPEPITRWTAVRKAAS